MVYRGKPSPSCERCRTRRLKCDYQRPSCASCIRAGAACTGYRDQSDFGFQDQSEEVVRNYHRSAKKKKEREKRSATSTPISPTTTGTLAAPALSIPSANNPPRSLAASVQDIARGYLYTNYMTGGPRTRYMAYLLPLMKDAQNCALGAAVTAVALAALSNIHASPRTMLKAHVEYSAALSATNQALRDPGICKRDDVLAAVVMLGIFEVSPISASAAPDTAQRLMNPVKIVSCTDTSFIDRWINHLDGAAKLLEARGPEQLSRLEGLDMFTQLRAQITLSKIYQQRHSAPILAHLTEETHRYRDAKDRILDQLGSMVIKLADFCADVKEGHFDKPVEIVQRALSIDAAFVSLLIIAPSTWSYTIAKVPTAHNASASPHIWGTTYQIYESIAASSMWNNYRCARILIQELILDTLDSISTSTEREIAFPQRHALELQCRQTALRLVEDICASVPFSLGSEMDMEMASDESADTAPANSPPYAGFAISGSGGLTLMWPLLVAANSGVAPKDLRDWIASCLDKIGHSMGINQALAMSKLLQDRMRTRAWLSPEYEMRGVES